MERRPRNCASIYRRNSQEPVVDSIEDRPPQTSTPLRSLPIASTSASKASYKAVQPRLILNISPIKKVTFIEPEPANSSEETINYSLTPRNMADDRQMVPQVAPVPAIEDPMDLDSENDDTPARGSSKPKRRDSGRPRKAKGRDLGNPDSPWISSLYNEDPLNIAFESMSLLSQPVNDLTDDLCDFVGHVANAYFHSTLRDWLDQPQNMIRSVRFMPMSTFNDEVDPILTKTYDALCWLVRDGKHRNEPYLISCFYGENLPGWRPNSTAALRMGDRTNGGKTILQMVGIIGITSTAMLHNIPVQFRDAIARKIPGVTPEMRKCALDKLPCLQAVVKHKDKELYYADRYFDVAWLISGFEHFLKAHAYSRCAVSEGARSIQPHKVKGIPPKDSWLIAYKHDDDFYNVNNVRHYLACHPLDYPQRLFAFGDEGAIKIQRPCICDNLSFNKREVAKFNNDCKSYFSKYPCYKVQPIMGLSIDLDETLVEKIERDTRIVQPFTIDGHIFWAVFGSQTLSQVCTTVVFYSHHKKHMMSTSDSEDMIRRFKKRYVFGKYCNFIDDKNSFGRFCYYIAPKADDVTPCRDQPWKKLFSALVSYPFGTYQIPPDLEVNAIVGNKGSCLIEEVVGATTRDYSRFSKDQLIELGVHSSVISILDSNMRFHVNS